MWRVALLLSLVTGSHLLSISEFSVPSSLKAGEDAHLRCEYELNGDESERALFVKWWWTPLESRTYERIQLYQRISKHNADVLHSYIQIEDGDNLVIENATPKYSGKYECEVSNIDEIRRNGDMIIFTEGSGPQLNITLVEDGPDEDTDEDVLVTCRVDDVAPEPDLIITINGEVVNANESVSPPEDGLFDMYATATVSRAFADDADISCELVYKNGNVTHPQYIDSEKYDADQTGLETTTEIRGDSTTTEAVSITVEDQSDAATAALSCALVVLTALAMPMIAVN